jgi:hypothetical protein
MDDQVVTKKYLLKLYEESHEAWRNYYLEKALSNPMQLFLLGWASKTEKKESDSSSGSSE